MTLGEILLSLALMSIVLVSATMTLQWALRGNIEQRRATEAAFLAQKVTEELWSRPALPPTGQGRELDQVWQSVATPTDSQLTDLTVAIYAADSTERLYQLRTRRRAFKRIVLIQNKAGIWQKHEDLAKLRLIAPGIVTEFSVSSDYQMLAYAKLEDDGVRQLVWCKLSEPAKTTALQSPPPQCFEPCFSPDGSQLAFTAYVDNRAQVCIAETTTGKWSNLSTSSSEEGSASWSSDGKSLVWCRDGTKIVWSKGNSTQVLLSDSQWKYKPRLSPDGTQLVFTGGQDGGPNVYSYNLRTQQLTKKTLSGFHKKPVFSQDGQRILFSKESQLYSMNLDGSASEALTTPEDGAVLDHTWLGIP